MVKGQAAFDYMMIAAFSLAMIIPVFYYAVTYSNDSIVTSQASDAVNTIAKAADNTYALGEGSLSQVQVSIPNGVVSNGVGNNTVFLRLRTTSGVSDILATTRSPVSGTLPKSPGSYFVTINNTGPTINISGAY